MRQETPSPRATANREILKPRAIVNRKIAQQQVRKEKAHCGGMNAVGLVELMVIETTTSSMRTKRSTN